ncbi:MAG: VWA domain-containing protein [Bacteroidales bacterium]|nr:VWA domain-containing protein [Bacteroidales bacterium]
MLWDLLDFPGFSEVEFQNPDFFWLGLVLIPMIVWYILKNEKSKASISFSGYEGFEKASFNYRYWFSHILFVLRIAAVASLIVILARPQSHNQWENVNTQGIEIVIAMDISGSMLAEDLQPNRLEAAKEVAMKFISGRPNDNIGLVVYSGESFPQCPLTMDHTSLLNVFAQVKNGMIEDGTAIGLGLANSVNLLKDSKSKSKVVILLTDGVNNRGMIEPKDAADLATLYNIRVYTIGVGKEGMAPYPVQTPLGVSYQNMEVEIDEDILIDIAKKTGGKYFRATNNESLKMIYEEIDQMEKTKQETAVHSRTQEEFFLFAFLAAIFVLCEILFRNLIFKTIP